MEPLVSAVDLAEKYEYPALVNAVQLRPMLAHEVDDFGMTPLHWICSDPKVPLRVLQKLVLVHPPATATKNLAGLLPLHIALRKNLPLEALKLLLKFYPKAIAVATPDGRSPLDLANEHVSTPSTRLFLQMLDAEVRALSRVTMTSKKTQKQQQLRDAAVATTITTPPVFIKPRGNSRTRNQRKMENLRSPANGANGGIGSNEPQKPHKQAQHAKENAFNSNNQLSTKEISRSTANTDVTAMALSPMASYRDPIADLLCSPSMRAARVQQHPPTWKLDKRCHICECKFGYFKSRHHCRNCGESVCGRHSRDTLPLRHIGLFEPQRVCAVCHEHLQNTLAGCNTNENNASSYNYNNSSRDSIASSSCCTPPPVTRPGVLNTNCSMESGSQSLFWSPEALSPRLFNIPPPPKRTKSVRDYLLQSPQAANSTTTTRSRNRTLDAGVSSPLVLSPTARSVRSESLRRNYSFATLSSLPMFPSSSSMFLSRVQLAPAPSQLLKVPEKQQTKQKQKTKTHNDDHTEASSSSRAQQRRLAKTELDVPSKMWYEELDQLPTAQTSQKLSMDSRVSELEEHVQKLLAAKRQIGEALKKSQLQIHMARAEKDKYDSIAQKYLDQGYALCSPRASSTTRGNSDPAMDRISQEEQPVESPSFASSPSENQQHHDAQEGNFDNEDDINRSTVSEENFSSDCVRPSSPLPAPRLSPFKSEKLELHIPLDVAATHHELGVILLGKCDFASAVAEFQESLDINGDNATAWYHLAKALDGTGDQEAAERAVNKSLALESDSLPSLSLLGRLLHLRGEHDEAIVVFRQALNLQCPPV